MKFISLLLGFALSGSNFFSLDELKEGDSVKGDQICNEQMCVPLIFQPTDQFQPIYPGQRIPKGLHIRIDYATGLKEAKLMDENENEGNTAVNVTPEAEEEIKDAIIHPPESTNNSALTWEERGSLSEIFQQLNNSSTKVQLQLLEQLAEAAHQVTRSNEQAFLELKELKPFPVLMESCKNAGNSKFSTKLKKRILNFLVDVKDYLNSEDLEISKWCEIAGDDQDMVSLLHHLKSGSCTRDNAEL
ncbi:nucleotide exchange factor sil1 [Terramyces sp. JEL0728]|nr:nucleotide exchange factor sil1 [Terramyces sp. JEL0728]